MLNILTSKEFSNNESVESISTIVCPNPFLADSVREQVNGTDLDVITISHFYKTLLKLLDKDFKIMRKADLLLHFSTLWKIKANHLSYAQFQQSYTLFSEVRSFTLDWELASEIIRESSPELSDLVSVFWFYVEHEDFYDEQRAYFELSQTLKEKNIYEEEQRIGFWGFTHFNSLQIDFLNSLSIRNEISLFVDELAIKRRKPTDWISWLLKNEKVSENEENTLTHYQIYSRDNFFNFVNSKKAKTNIYWAKDTLSYEDAFLLGKMSSFKIDMDLFESSIDLLFSSLNERFNFYSNDIDTDEIKFFLLDRISSQKEEFRLLKATSLFLQTLGELESLSDSNKKITLNDLLVIKEILKLNKPRLSTVSTGKDFNLYDSRSIPFVKDEENIIVLPKDSFYNSSEKSIFSEEVQKKLASIGPLKNLEIDNYTLLSNIIRSQEYSNTNILVEENSWEDNVFLNEILEEKDKDNINLPNDDIQKSKNISYLRSISKSKFEGKVSASKLQTYIDCPAKFYFTYVDDKTFRTMSKVALRADELGVIEHEIIQKYFENEKELDQKRLIQYSTEEVKTFLRKNNRWISEKVIEETALETLNSTFKPLEFLYKIKDEDPTLNFYFEKKVIDESSVGYIDLLIENNDISMLIDFKRSSSSIPSGYKFESFEKVQLWFYLKRIQSEKLVLTGYLNLSDLSDSLFYKINDDAFKYNSFNDYDIKLKKFKDSFANSVKEYDVFEEEVIEKIFSEESFKDLPIDESSCSFCHLKNVCERGDLQ